MHDEERRTMHLKRVINADVPRKTVSRKQEWLAVLNNDSDIEILPNPSGYFGFSTSINKNVFKLLYYLFRKRYIIPIIKY